MNEKSKKLKREFVIYKALAILDIVVAVIAWVFIAYIWGMMEAIRGSLPWNAVIAFFAFVILLGVFLLGNGILTLHFTGRVAEVLKDAHSDED